MTNANPTADLSDHLARLVYELLDAHYDTIRLVEDAAEDECWHAHLAYLRDLQRVARELLATATADDGAPGSGRLRRALGRARRVGRGHQTAHRSARPPALHE
jgi:hypothetical protein